jgi:hypothetical protein
MSTDTDRIEFEADYRTVYPLAASLQPDLFVIEDGEYHDGKAEVAFQMWRKGQRQRAPEFNPLAAARLRGVCGLLGLASEIPLDDAALMDSQFSVFGAIARRVRLLKEKATAKNRLSTESHYPGADAHLPGEGP